MVRRTGLTKALILAVLGSSAVASGAPVIFCSDGADLEKRREEARAGEKMASAIAAKYTAGADTVLAVQPPVEFSVVNKPFTPGSGDKHDYMSLSPYWWADPTKPDGKPYVRRDGQFNPEREKYDLGTLEKFAEAVETLAMAYYFTGEEKYAAKAAGLMRTWFLDPKTKMNPNLTFAQSVPGYDKPRPSGIIEGGRFRKVVDAVGLIRGSASWSAEDDRGTKAWFKGLLNYIETSEQGKAEIAQPNNHGTWVHVQMATYALFIGDDAKAKTILDGGFKKLVDSQIKPDGSQPEELARTLSFHYSRFNLLALIELATLGERVGLDLWNYTTPDGRGIRKALDFLVPYALEEKTWEHKQISPIKYGDMVMVLRRAANAYKEPKYEAAAKKLMEKDRRELVEFLYPSKL